MKKFEKITHNLNTDNVKINNQDNSTFDNDYDTSDGYGKDVRQVTNNVRNMNVNSNSEKKQNNDHYNKKHNDSRDYRHDNRNDKKRRYGNNRNGDNHQDVDDDFNFDEESKNNNKTKDHVLRKKFL